MLSALAACGIDDGRARSSYSPSSYKFYLGLLPWEWQIFRYGVSKTFLGVGEGRTIEDAEKRAA